MQRPDCYGVVRLAKQASAQTLMVNFSLRKTAKQDVCRRTFQKILN
ncbi:hypothetical protein PSEUDO8O_120366 [Pseudomonas sp. 8O]|nr:hypothetical protein PSEUDO8O_120366 [Pseudomonas sp. 8O]